MRLIWLTITALVLITSAGAQEPDPLLPPLPEARYALSQALAAGGIISPAAAVQAPAAFWNSSGWTGRVMSFEPSEYLAGGSMDYVIEISDPPDHAGIYHLRASDGWLHGAVYDEAENPPDPSLDSQQCLTTAQGYLSTHYPGLIDATWCLNNSRNWSVQSGWQYRWSKILDPISGAESDAGVVVEVSNRTGRVLSAFIHGYELTGPTAPQVTQAQAAQIAAQVTHVDPVQYPFLEVRLQMGEDAFGVQVPWWMFCQAVPLPDPEEGTEDVITSVNGLTGEAFCPYGLGAPMSKKPRKPDHRAARKGTPVPIRLRMNAGKPFTSVLPPEMRQGRLWIRAELLKGLGAKVKRDEKTLEVRFDKDAPLGVADLSARRKENGWWVPLRAVAARCGWKVRWDGRARLATIKPV